MHLIGDIYKSVVYFDGERGSNRYRYGIETGKIPKERDRFASIFIGIEFQFSVQVDGRL